MFRIIGQPISMRNLGRNVPKEKNKSWEYVVRIAEFGITHGYKAAVDTFTISKSSYYNYVTLYKSGKGLKSKRPINVRRANWNTKIVKFIRKIRTDRPNIGKSKIKFYLDKFCSDNLINSISTGTIQNIINSHKNKLRTKKSILTIKRRLNVLRKPSNYKPKLSGECIALDTMEFRHNGKSYML